LSACRVAGICSYRAIAFFDVAIHERPNPGHAVGADTAGHLTILGTWRRAEAMNSLSAQAGDNFLPAEFDFSL